MKEESLYKSIILHIPHSSTLIPKEVREQFVLTDEELASEQLKLVDLHTKDLFYSGEFPKVEAEVSRLVCDVERFLDPQQEPMSQYGMGAIYTKTLEGLPLRRELSKEEEKRLLDRHYHQHQIKVGNRVEEALEDNSIAVIVDCHSFPSEPFPYEKPSKYERPDICIGANFLHHTPEWLRDLTRQHFSKLGYSFLFNDPFEGCYIPTNFYKQDKGVFGVMIEINRKLYMDEVTGKKTKGYSALKTHIQEYYIKLKEYVDKIKVKPEEREHIYDNLRIKMRQVFGEEMLQRGSSERYAIADLVEYSVKGIGHPDLVSYEQLEGIRKIVTGEMDDLAFHRLVKDD